MIHSFDIKIAKQYGIEEAIILNNIYFWIEKNKANHQHFYDGKYWTFNSKKAFAELFPYMNERKIDYAINNLVKNGLIEKGNYNKLGFDRTLWYSITNIGYCILQNCEMEETKLLNPSNKIVKPIPDKYNHIINNDIKPIKNIKKDENYIDIFNFWNSKKIIEHRELNNEISTAISKALKKYSLEQIKTCIDRYEKVLSDQNSFFNYKWTLAEFLTRKNGINDFLDDGSKWANYCNNINIKKGGNTNVKKGDGSAYRDIR